MTNAVFSHQAKQQNSLKRMNYHLFYDFSCPSTFLFNLNSSSYSYFLESVVQLEDGMDVDKAILH